MRRPGWAVLLAAAAMALRLALITGPPLPDEVGYLLVAAHARPHGPFLYGDLWVDRPPLLVGLFAAADALATLVGDPVLALRLLVAAGVGLLVLAACAAGARLGGRRGSLLAGVVAGALASTPLLGAPAADGEVLAVPLVMTSIALALGALRPVARPGTSVWPTGLHDPVRGASPGGLALMCSAGVLAGAAALIKQNVVDAGVFVVATVLVAALARTTTWARAAALLAATAAGVALAVGAALVWAAVWGTGPVGVYEALVGFRSASLDVIATHRVANPVRRAWLLAGAAVLSGLAPLVGLLVVRVVRGARSRTDPVGAGLVAMVLWGMFSVAAGGSWWTHYLVELVPLAALSAAWLVGATGQGSSDARELRAGRRTLVAVPVLVVLTVVSSLAASAVVASGATRPALARTGCAPDAYAGAAVAAWLRDRTSPGDDAVTAYGGVSVLAGTDLQPAYPYLWSLPVRTLDPGLDALAAAVTGPERVTWVVRTLPLRSFGLDADGRLAAVLADGYRQVHQVCGEKVLLRDDAMRPAR